MNSDTPRTDKWEYEQDCNFDVPWEEHCRTLERELAAAIRERDLIKQSAGAVAGLLERFPQRTPAENYEVAKACAFELRMAVNPN